MKGFFTATICTASVVCSLTAEATGLKRHTEDLWRVADSMPIKETARWKEGSDQNFALVYPGNRDTIICSYGDNNEVLNNPKVAALNLGLVSGQKYCFRFSNNDTQPGAALVAVHDKARFINFGLEQFAWSDVLEVEAIMVSRTAPADITPEPAIGYTPEPTSYYTPDPGESGDPEETEEVCTKPDIDWHPDPSTVEWGMEFDQHGRVDCVDDKQPEIGTKLCDPTPWLPLATNYCPAETVDQFRNGPMCHTETQAVAGTKNCPIFDLNNDSHCHTLIYEAKIAYGVDCHEAHNSDQDERGIEWISPH